jgi:type IV fimbrial biogenesis protein FimT
MFELMVALAIAALLTSLAVPGFAGLRRSAGLSSAANELLWALHMARSSAVLRGLPVAVCLTGDDQTCLAAPDVPAVGWLVFLPEGQATVTRPGPVGTLLHSFHLPAGLAVSGTRPAVTFWPVSRASSTSTFDLCDVRAHGPGRSIVVSQTGRARVAAEAAPCAG